MPITDEDEALFANRSTTLAAIKAAGWHVYHSSSGKWWFDRNTGGGVPDHFFVPVWIRELEIAAEKRGISQTRGDILLALGLSACGSGKAVKFRGGDTD